MPMSWVFCHQDFSRHLFDDQKPPVARTYFATQDEALAAARAFRADHQDPDVFVISVYRTKQRKAPIRLRQADLGFPLANGGWRLT